MVAWKLADQRRERQIVAIGQALDLLLDHHHVDRCFEAMAGHVAEPEQPGSIAAQAQIEITGQCGGGTGHRMKERLASRARAR